MSILTAGGGLSELSIKDAQINAIQRMLAFNDENATTGTAGAGGASANSYDSTGMNQWKLLIYDTDCRNVLSPIVSVQQLRRLGVTLYLLLHAEREAIPDVPAIYFVRPTKENLVRIATDCAKQLYSRVHLNFISKLDRTLMEEFAKLIVQSNTLSTIASIHDQYIDFICYEKNLFTLLGSTNQQAAKSSSAVVSTSYASINQSGTTEEMMDSIMTTIAYGLFSVIATIGQIPIIRCPAGGAPEMVGRKLCRMISEHPTLMHTKKSSTYGRPLLVLFDRNSDLITPIQHTSTYQALIDDLLQHKANRVEFETVQDPDSRRPKKEIKKFDLDPDSDPFYVQQKFQPFPEAIEQNSTELQEVTTREQAIRAKTSGSAAISNDPLAGLGAADLATAVDSLPALLDRKKQLEVHTSILHAVMNEVASRDVPQFFELESSLATGSYRNDPAKAKKDVIALVGDANKGSVMDKIRVLLVYALATGAKSSDIDEVVTSLQTSLESKVAQDKTIKAKLDNGLQAVSYFKKLRSMHMIPAANDMYQETFGASSSSAATPLLSTFMAKATTQATGFLAKATERVSTMMTGKTHKHPATVVVENLCEMRAGSEDETYLYLDPKVKNGDVNVTKLQGIQRATIKDVIVFMIGGGCYGEYQNLQLLSAGGKRTICYGSTELINSETFVHQLGQLG